MTASGKSIVMTESLRFAFELVIMNTRIVLCRIVLPCCPKPLGRAGLMDSLADLLYARFQSCGSMPDLDEALALRRNGLQLRPQGHPARLLALNNIVVFLSSRFEQLGMLPDIQEALALQRSVVGLCPEGHPERITFLTNLPTILYLCFKQSGTLSDLDEAIALQRNVLELCSEGHPTRAFLLSNLTDFVSCRFDQLGTLSDLHEAVALERNALELYPKRHPDRTRSLSHLAVYLRSRFEELGTLSDISEAVALERSALELRPEGHLDRGDSLHSLADSLHIRFEQLGSLPDLEEAIALGRCAVELCPEGYRGRAVSLDNLARFLHTRFKQLGTLSDLEEALTLARSTLVYRPRGHPDRVFSLGPMAFYLYTRFSTTHDPNDLHEISDLYSQLSEITRCDFYILKHGHRLIQAAEESGDPSTVSAYQTFLNLITQHLATLPSLPQHLAVLKQLTTSIAVDAFSACIRYGHPANAVELAEQGRGVFWNQLTRLRSPLDEVIASGNEGKRLADNFTQLTSVLRRVLDAPLDAESHHDQACRLNIQLQDIVTEIRKLPGFSRFLQPPLLSDLRSAASSGPVIIVNASQYSCDALVVLSDKDPVHIDLLITKAQVSELSMQLRSLRSRARFSDLTREFFMFLRELWDMIVSPIVTVLREFCPRGSRIWWCPTAEFSLLPLHAAGSFRKGQPMFSDLYISSYTPTLAALIRAREEPSDPSIEQHRFLIVGQAQAPGQCELPSVNIELSTVSQRIGPSSALTCVQDQDATTANVAEELKKSEFVHFACHGIPDQKRPFESGFALGDGLLKIENIMQYNLQNAQFAYLSACHTTVGDEESPDEVIHLAAAMQFAGFRSVIGTMWAVDDAHTNEITSRFYEYMLDDCGRLDHTRAALALHRTMRSLRSSKIPIDQRILYIHIGA